MSKENIYTKRVLKLRELMRQKNIEAFLVTHDDEHLLENTSKNFERLNWIIGFSGSAGYLLITLNELLPKLRRYTFGLIENNRVIPAIIFVCAAAIVVLKPLAVLLSRIGTNYIFLLLCLLQAIILYIGMQYYPDTYTIGYLLFPASVVVFMLGAIYSTNRIDGTTGN